MTAASVEAEEAAVLEADSEAVAAVEVVAASGAVVAADSEAEEEEVPGEVVAADVEADSEVIDCSTIVFKGENLREQFYGKDYE